MATSKSAGAKAAAAATATDAAAAPDGTETAGAAKADVLKMKDFVQRVSAATEGGKKRVSRETIDATLKVLADALKAGESFQLPPLGRGRVVKSADGMITLKLRQGQPAKAAANDAQEGLAAAEE